MFYFFFFFPASTSFVVSSNHQELYKAEQISTSFVRWWIIKPGKTLTSANAFMKMSYLYLSNFQSFLCYTLRKIFSILFVPTEESISLNCWSIVFIVSCDQEKIHFLDNWMALSFNWCRFNGPWVKIFFCCYGWWLDSFIRNTSGIILQVNIDNVTFVHKHIKNRTN